MHLFLPLIAISIVSVISLLSAKETTSIDKTKTDTPTPTAETTITHTPTHTPTTTQQHATHTPTNTPPTQNPTQPPQSQSTNTGDFVYPGSTSTGGDEYTSSDSADSITNWYKDKIKSTGMNVTSFVVTKTNDNVNNVLVGARNNQEIRVTITKDSGESQVHIKISTKNS